MVSRCYCHRACVILRAMTVARSQELARALSLLPALNWPNHAGRNGEELATDEASVWKRVLNFRIASHLCAQRVFESHPGLGISSSLYRFANQAVQIYGPQLCQEDSCDIDLIDFDPFGQPWDCIEKYRKVAIKRGGLLLSDKYINSNTPLLWQCKQEHQWKAKPVNVIFCGLRRDDFFKVFWNSSCYR